MVNRSCQHEIPDSRINITLDVKTEGASKKVELPLSLLLIGDYSARQSREKFAHRSKMLVTKDNVDQLMKHYSPKININIKNAIQNDNSDLNVCLNFDQMAAFHPDHIAKHVPELAKLLAMRNILKEFRTSVTDNNRLKHKLEEIVGNDHAFKLLAQELQEEGNIL